MSFGFPQPHINHRSSDVLHIGLLFQISFEERCAKTTVCLEKTTTLCSPTSLFCKLFTLRPRKANNLFKITQSVRCELDFLMPRSLSTFTTLNLALSLLSFSS